MLVLLARFTALVLVLLPMTDSVVGADKVPKASSSRSISLSGGAPVFNNPAIADVDGNPANGTEIVTASQSGTVTALRTDGTVLWSAKVPEADCNGDSSTFSSPAVGALFGDGVPYVVIGYGSPGSTTCDGGIVAIRGTDGVTAWNFSLRQHNQQEHIVTFRAAVWSTPALADVDFDGRMEIGFGALDRNVYLLNADGSVRWYYMAADTVWSSPAFVNLRGNRNLEMVIGTDISANNRLKPRTRNGGYVYAFDTKQRSRTRIPFRAPRGFVWQRFFNQVIQSSPVVGDVIPASPGPEIVVGSGCFFPQNQPVKRGTWFKVLRRSDGRVLQTFDAPGCSTSSAALADIDGDGKSEVIAMIPSPEAGKPSTVAAWKAPARAPIWVTAPVVGGQNDPTAGSFQSAVVGDIDNNGSLEVLVTSGAGVAVLDAATGAQLSCATGSGCASSFTLSTDARLRSSPSLADINRDGRLEVVANGANDSGGELFFWGAFSKVSQTGTGPSSAAPWPMWRGNPARTGLP